MRWATRVRLRLRSLFQRSRVEEEIDEELRYHLERQIDELVKSGCDPSAARYAALRDIGGLEHRKEECRDALGLRLLDEFRQDLRYAVRTLARNRGFTAVAMLTLAIGSGANAAIFSIFNQALLRHLPVSAPEQLVNLSSPGPKTGRTSTGGTFRSEHVFSYPLFRDLERDQRAFTGIAAHREFVAHVSYRDQASSEEGRLVSGSYFPVLALGPALGRLLGPDDDRTRGMHPVVVLSHPFWQTRFNANPAVLNDTLVVNGQPLTIVGVAPRDFAGTTLENRPQIFVPLTMAALMMPGLRNPHDGGAWNGLDDRRDHWVYLFARLQPALSRENAERIINVPFRALINDVELPAQRSGLGSSAREQFKNRRLLLEPGSQGQRPERGELGQMFVLLFCVAALVVIIACANIVNLLLARAASHERDITIRLSLGAGRARLVRQMLTESFLLAAGGGLIGLALARWTLTGIAALVANQADAMLRFELDRTVFVFTIVLCSGMALLIGLYPALLATRRDLASALKGGTAGGPSAARIRASLATAQVALSMGLLVTAGLFTRSLANVSRVELGIRVTGVTTFRVAPELNGYSPDRSGPFFERAREELLKLPAVSSVGVSTIPVLAGIGHGSNVTVEGFVADADTNTSSYSMSIGPDYFRTLGIPLIAGREFTESDVLGAPKVAIVNEAFARKFNLGAAGVGKRMRPGAGRPPDIEIVGLVKDARYSQPKDAPPPQFFLPYRQIEQPGTLNFYIRSTASDTPLASAIRAVLNRIDPTVPIENLRPLADQVGATTALDRLIGTLAAGFALVATLLAAIGLYGVLSYNMARRTRELGLRIALGATIARVWRLVFRDVGRITAAGCVLGAFAALALGQLAQSLLFNVPGYDITVMLAATAGIALVAAIAGAIPARHAAHIDAMQALRCE
jgi:putative ABC transport system permease protein